MLQKDAAGIENSVDPDQTALFTALFPHTHLSEKGSLWYHTTRPHPRIGKNVKVGDRYYQPRGLRFQYLDNYD